jgi:hypothetical protein
MRLESSRSTERESAMQDERLASWLDGEMSEAEAQEFLSSLSEADRREAQDLAAIVGAAHRLPRPAPAPGFTARTMARVLARRPPRRSLWTWLRAPRLSPLAALGGAALVAAGAFGLAAWLGGARARLGPSARAQPALTAVARTPPGPQTVLARLAIRAPQAREVAVAGDFNGWNPEASHLHRGQGGVWVLEVPLSAGRRYEYMFVVDGQWVTDPQAPASADDGFGGKNAVLQL